MYSIDINLLNDRSEYADAYMPSGQVDSGDKTPLYLGFAFAGSLLGLVMATFGVITIVNQNLVAEEAELDAQLALLAPQLAEMDSLKAQEQQVRTETQALAQVFTQIKPWSATLQDIRDRVPPSLQITKIVQKTDQPKQDPKAKKKQEKGKEQEEGKGTEKQETANAGAPKQNSNLTISGKSLSFGDVNDFVLTLRQSPFLKSGQTELVKSSRSGEGKAKVSLVQYELRAKMGDVPATELLQALRAKGATGLVSRIETLKQQGVFKP